MEIDIQDSLDVLGYSGPLTDEAAFKKAIENGPKSIEFTELTEWLSKELQVLCNLESHVNALSDPEDSSSFLLEVSSFLKELYCPYSCLLEGPISQRLIDKKNKILLLDFLCSELQSARVIAIKNQDKKNTLDIEMEASPTAHSLTVLLHALDTEITYEDDKIETLFTNATNKIKELIATLPEEVLEPAFSSDMSVDSWSKLETIQNDMYKEYTVRRELLLKRIDLTVQSFKWGEQFKGKEDEITKIYLPLRKKLKAEPSVRISDLLAASKDIVIMEKTSSASVRKNTKTSINRVLIGDVPDRGGRPKEQKPPTEMPSWKKRSQFGNDSRGGFRGGNRGGHFKKNWSDTGQGRGSKRKNRENRDSGGAFDAAGSY